MLEADKINKIKTLALILGPIASIFLGLFMLSFGWLMPAALTAAVTVLCAIWWIFEPVPIPVTSLIPLAVFPLFGVLDKTQIAESYGNPLILLLLGGFILSTGMAKSGAHQRIALGMINLFGGNSSRRIVFGFMAASAALSMWISNTATTLMLLPVALAVLEDSKDKRLAVPLLLGVCYAASLGGIGTPIGTPPNLFFMKVYTEQVDPNFGFTDWMLWGIPVVIIFLPLMAWWLTRHLNSKQIKNQQTIELPEVGQWQPIEIRTLTIFALTALAWITRQAPFGGWSDWLMLPNANDAAVALIAVVLMFVIPDGQSDGKGGRLLDWETANKIPWGMLLLFAGGIAIAKAFMASGLGGALAEQLKGFSGLPIILILISICLLVTFMTEITSNTATTTLLMPVLAAAAIAADVDPALFMVPAAMSASCAFMLPVATAPNAVIYGSGRVTIQEMVRYGFVLNLVGALVIIVVCYFILV